MKKLPITLGIARSARSPHSSGSGGGLSSELKQKIFDRDKNKCRCCLFEAKKYQDILFLNGNAADQRPENMATTCIFCQQCFQIDKVSGMKSGVLVWLPEIPQDSLHHIARAIYVARISQGPMAESARASLDILMKRREEMRHRLGTDDPYILSAVLKDYIGPKAYELRRQKLDGVRLFPLDRRIIKEADLEFNQFPQILAYWRSKDGPFGGKIPKTWVKMYKTIHEAA
jgi:intracellular multiplication protein IcmJ